MTEQQMQEVEHLVDYKVKVRVAKKVMRDIHHQVDQIENEVSSEKKNSRYFLLSVLLLSLVLLMAIYAPDFMRIVSSLLNAA